jgi:uncharacterized protein
MGLDGASAEPPTTCCNGWACVASAWAPGATSSSGAHRTWGHLARQRTDLHRPFINTAASGDVFGGPEHRQLEPGQVRAQSAERSLRARGQLHPPFVYTKCVFQWDPRKAEANAAKHGVSFDDAVTVFLDKDALDGADLRHSKHEMRFLRMGRAADGRVLMVAYTLRRIGDAETIRIISARRASRRERAAYNGKD